MSKRHSPQPHRLEFMSRTPRPLTILLSEKSTHCRVEAVRGERSSGSRSRKTDPICGDLCNCGAPLQIILGVRFDSGTPKDRPLPGRKDASCAASAPGADATMTTPNDHDKAGRSQSPQCPQEHGTQDARGQGSLEIQRAQARARARTLVLPGEDAGAFQDRLDAWASDLRPRNDVEQVLVERSATLSWQLERADRADAARLDPSSSPRRPRRRSGKRTRPPRWASGCSGTPGALAALPPYPSTPHDRIPASPPPGPATTPTPRTPAPPARIHGRRLPMAARPLGRARRPAGPGPELAVARQAQGDPPAGPATAGRRRFGGGGADLPGVPRPRPPARASLGCRAGRGEDLDGCHPRARRHGTGAFSPPRDGVGRPAVDPVELDPEGDEEDFGDPAEPGAAGDLEGFDDRPTSKRGRMRMRTRTTSRHGSSGSTAGPPSPSCGAS